MKKRRGVIPKMDEEGNMDPQYYDRCRVGFCKKKVVRNGLCHDHLGAIIREEEAAKVLRGRLI